MKQENRLRSREVDEKKILVLVILVNYFFCVQKPGKNMHVVSF